VKKLVLAAMIVAFGAAVILPAVAGPDNAYAATKKKDSKKKKKPMGKTPSRM
jgi:hypothetical protein